MRIVLLLVLEKKIKTVVQNKIIIFIYKTEYNTEKENFVIRKGILRHSS